MEIYALGAVLCFVFGVLMMVKAIKDYEFDRDFLWDGSDRRKAILATLMRTALLSLATLCCFCGVGFFIVQAAEISR